MGYPSVVFPLLSPLFWLRSIYALSACVPLAWWCGCPPVVRLLMVGCGGVSFLCSSFVFPLFSGMIRRQNATQYHPFLTVAPPSGFRTFNRRFSVGFPLLYRCLNVQATPLYCGFVRSPFSGCCFVVLSSFPQALPIARRYPILTPKNSRSIRRHEIRVITRIARCAIV